MPSDSENETIAMDLFVGLIGGSRRWCAQARFVIALCATVMNSRIRLGRNEMLELQTHIPKYPVPTAIPRVGVLAEVPHELKMFVGENKCFKVEWMLNGHYKVSMSDEYAKDVIDEALIRMVSVNKCIPAKLVDNFNLSDPEVAFSMWNNSLIYPKTGIKYTGSGFRRSDLVVTRVTARVMSCIIGAEYVITASTVGTPRLIEMS